MEFCSKLVCLYLNIHCFIDIYGFNKPKCIKARATTYQSGDALGAVLLK
jgi:hypothetical protein